MAKSRKRKKPTFKTSLKYEAFGILILIFSVISLAGIGPVGRSLNSLCLFLMGYLFFIIPLFFIYIGLYVMIKRQWPKSWSYRKTGILLAVIAILVTYHMDLIHRLFPAGEYSSSDVLSQSYQYIKDMIFLQDTFLENASDNLGGGMLGAILYGALYFFFDHSGSRLFVIALFLIAFICLTGLSYVELGKKLRQGFAGFVKQLKSRVSDIVDLLRTRKSRKVNLSATAPYAEDLIDLEDENDSANDLSLEAPDKRPAFLNWTEDSISAEQLMEQESVNVKQPLDVETTINSTESEILIPLYRDFQVAQEPSHDDDLKEVLITADSEQVIDQSATEALNESTELFENAEHEQVDKPASKPYQLPPFSLLTRPAVTKGTGASDYKANARKLEATLESFGVRTKVLEVVRGPTVTRYELQPDIGVKVSRIVSLTDDIALALAAKDIRMEAPIPGKSAVGIEVPNTEVSMVTMREVMESSAFLESTSKLSITLGRDISGTPIIANLAKMPHLLVAGATGSGKSVCVNSIITSILYKAKPNEVKFLMIDPKKVELNVYNGIPHLLAPVVTDPRRASLALKKVVSEMEKRYDLFSNSGTRNIEGYNEMLSNSQDAEPLPYIVVIVDELADLMMIAAKDVEDAICRLAQMARAAGIHLIIATQRPSVDVITGLIKANIPSRIAFGVSSQVDSRTILDTVGAEKLLGRGDMLFLPVGASKSVRVQGAFLSDHEVESVVGFVKNQQEVDYQEEMVPQVDDFANQVDEPPEDELFGQAVQIILEAKQASVSLLQRRMRIGYTRAARLIDSMEAKGIVGPYEGSKPREVLITFEQFQESQTSS